jgi:hypothetical protein
MTLPQLYKDITLVSYDTIRYRGQRPEGCGSASPFSMGLNALVTRNIASLVHSLTLRGEWKEHDIEDHGKVGRVPDNSMMLNIAARAAVDHTTALQSFTWDLNTKMLLPVYGGLAARPTLKSLTIRFPSTRHPRPMVNVPPFPNLESLKITHIDPLCYPDDISNCLLRSPQLHTLKMHFSPRMRAESEPSVNLHYFFRKITAEPNFKLRLKTLAYQNLFSLPSGDELETTFDHETLENITILNSTGDDEVGGAPISFIDASWEHKPPKDIIRLKSIRFDRLSHKNVESMTSICGLERMYFVSAPPEPWPPLPRSVNPLTITDGAFSNHHSSPITPSTTHSSQTPSTASSSNKYALRDSFLKALFANHGTTLQHLLLPSRWTLSPDLVTRLIRSCPNLTQLGIAVESKNLDNLRLLLSFLPKLRALRLLRSSEFALTSEALVPNPHNLPDGPPHTVNGIPCPPPPLRTDHNTTNGNADANEKGKQKVKAALLDMGAAGIEMISDEVHIAMMGRVLATDSGEYAKLKYVGLGKKVFEIGGLQLITVPAADGEGEGEKVWSRKVRRIPEEKVMHVEIWGLDSTEI